MWNALVKYVFYLIITFFPAIAFSAVPAAPTGLALVAVSTLQVDLSWKDNAVNETAYKVERKTGVFGVYKEFASLGSNVAKYSDFGPTEGAVYYYRVRATNSGGYSGYSNEIVVTIPVVALKAPTSLKVTPVSVALKPFQVNLTWLDNASNESGYLVEEATSSAGPWTQVIKLPVNSTSYSRSGLAASTSYYYRVRAYNSGANSGYTGVSAVKTVAKHTASFATPKGIYLLGDNSGKFGLGSLSSANKPYIDGFAWRVGWNMLDTGITAPNYDFTAVDAAITGVQAIGKKLSLAIMILSVPDHVMNNAQQTWTSPGVVKGMGVKTVVPWDANAITQYRNFMFALAEHQIYDSISRKMVKLRDHPALGQINASTLGLQTIRDTGTLVTLPGFSRDVIKQALLDSIHAVQDQFPAKPNYVTYWGLEDGKQPSLSDEILLKIMGEFDGVKYPLIGFFNEALEGNSPGMYPDQNASQNGYFVMFQACGSWLLHDQCNWSLGDNSPENGFKYGTQNFDAKYYEIYRADLEEPAFKSIFETWHATLVK